MRIRDAQPAKAAPRLRGAFAGVLRVFLCVAMSVLLALVPVGLNFSVSDSLNPCVFGNSAGVEVYKSDAHAIVPVAAGAAGAALAAELGISVEALYLGTAAIIAGATGYMVTSDAFNNMNNDLGLDYNWKRLFEPGIDVGDMTNDDNYSDDYLDGSLTPAGSPLWDDLDTDEKAKYGTPAAYNLSCWDSLELELGLLQSDGNGGYEPTPTPEGPSPLQKLKNALTVIGVTGGAVALGEASKSLVDFLGDRWDEFWFGENDPNAAGAPTYGLGIIYDEQHKIGDATVDFKVIAFNHYTYKSGSRASYLNTNNWAWGNSTSIGSNVNAYYEPYIRDWTMTQKSNGSGGYYYQSNSYGSGANWPYPFTFSGNALSNISLTSNFQIHTGQRYLNRNYSGSYVFSNGATLSNGTWTGEHEVTDVEYGQITGTPNDVTRNILDTDALGQGLENYETDGLPNGQKRAIVLPSGYGEPGFEPEYSDFVKEMPEDKVTPLPDDEPVVQPEPDEPDVPVEPDNPDVPNFNFPDELENATDKLVNAAFYQLFPFCLIGDMRTLAEKVTGGSYAGGSLQIQDAEDYNTLVIPLGDFGIPGVQNIRFDLTEIFALGNMCRNWWTVLFGGMLIAESVRYFLK